PSLRNRPHGPMLRLAVARLLTILLVSSDHHLMDQAQPQDCPPFLRWAGSKRRLLPVLQSFWTAKHKRYVEPFAGSACLFFALKPPKAILGDLNPELVATYIEVKYRLSGVLADLHKIPKNDADEYKRLRSTAPKEMGTSARAA